MMLSRTPAVFPNASNSTYSDTQSSFPPSLPNNFSSRPSYCFAPSQSKARINTMPPVPLPRRCLSPASLPPRVTDDVTSSGTHFQKPFASGRFMPSPLNGSCYPAARSVPPPPFPNAVIRSRPLYPTRVPHPRPPPTLFCAAERPRLMTSFVGGVRPLFKKPLRPMRQFSSVSPSRSVSPHSNKQVNANAASWSSSAATNGSTAWATRVPCERRRRGLSLSGPASDSLTLPSPFSPSSNPVDQAVKRKAALTVQPWRSKEISDFASNISGCARKNVELVLKTFASVELGVPQVSRVSAEASYDAMREKINSMAKMCSTELRKLLTIKDLSSIKQALTAISRVAQNLHGTDTKAKVNINSIYSNLLQHLKGGAILLKCFLQLAHYGCWSGMHVTKFLTTLINILES